MLCRILSVTVAVCAWGVVWGDANPSPYLFFPQSWAAQAFGTSQEIASQSIISQRQVDDTSLPAIKPAHAHPSPLFAIRDVQAPTQAIATLRQPSINAYHPLWIVPSPMFFHAMHLRTQSHQQDPSIVPASAPSALAFAQRHTAQVPFLLPNYPYVPTPIVFPNQQAQSPIVFPTRQAQSPIVSVFQECDDDDDEDEDNAPHYVTIRRFPTEIATPFSLRGAGDEGPLAPAGIVQSSQPTIDRVEFTNAKAHPSLRKTKPGKDSGVLAV